MFWVKDRNESFDKSVKVAYFRFISMAQREASSGFEVRCARRYSPRSGEEASTWLKLRGFTLVELLVVIAIISILAALLLPVLSKARSKALSIVCKNNEHEMGLALNMYVADFHFYPYANTINGPYFMFWYQALVPYYPPGAFGSVETGTGGYTNLQCPSLKGLILQGNENFSYAYNRSGTGIVPPPSVLGLGGLQGMHGLVAESSVVAPSGMYAVADARVLIDARDDVVHTFNEMTCFGWGQTLYMEGVINRHGNGFNFLFCDGHVQLVNRSFYLNLTNSCLNWNSDHQPHPETWALQ